MDGLRGAEGFADVGALGGGQIVVANAVGDRVFAGGLEITRALRARLLGQLVGASEAEGEEGGDDGERGEKSEGVLHRGGLVGVARGFADAGEGTASVRARLASGARACAVGPLSGHGVTARRRRGRMTRRGVRSREMRGVGATSVGVRRLRTVQGASVVTGRGRVKVPRMSSRGVSIALVVLSVVLLVSACSSPDRAAGAAGDDVHLIDDSGRDGGAADTDAGTDLPPLPDTTDAPPAGADLGEPCDEDADCLSNLCADVVPGDGGGVCTSPCVGDAACPRDFDCVLLTESGGDATRVCLPVDLCIDPDGDEHGIGPGCLGRDCDEENADTHGSADEICDGLDNDCDGDVDEAAINVGRTCRTGFAGVCEAGRTSCVGGLVECEQIEEASAEVCDARDNDCDGDVDEDDDGAALSRECYDGDVALAGVGECALGYQTCTDGGFSACIGQVLATAEICDGLDNDCDGDEDEDLTLIDYFPDADGDTFGSDAAEALSDCARPPGYVENASDCDDDDASVRPGAGEIPGDGVDQNCDDTEFCFEDADDDGYRPPGAGAVVSLDEDCDDEGEARADQPAGDCDDRQPTVYPGAPEVCDGLNNDCDDRTDEGERCYAVGLPCVDPEDCATGLCEAELCVAPITCIEDGSCPQRLAGSAGGGRVSSSRFTLEVSSPVGPTTPPLESERFRLNVGTAPYLTDP